MNKFLVIGPATSAEHYSKLDLELETNIKLIGMHRVFPYLRDSLRVELDYWTWSDPDAAIDGLRIYMSATEDELTALPTIILPYYQRKLELFNVNCGTSPLYSNAHRLSEREFYEKSLEYLSNKGKVKWIENAINTKIISKDHLIFSDPSVRFNGKNTYFGTVPFDGRNSNSQWARENKFTSYMLPMCHYLGATHVFCLGFDNVGTGIKRTVPQSANNPRIISDYLSKFTKWTHDWVGHHKMDIYSVVDDKFTPNNLVMNYLPINEINNINTTLGTPFIVSKNFNEKLLENLKNNKEVKWKR